MGKKKKSSATIATDVIADDGGERAVDDDGEDERGELNDSGAPTPTPMSRAPKRAAGLSDKIIDVCVELAARFVLNAPEEELADSNRLLFLVEQAHWYYVDFVREKDQTLPGKTLKAFAEMMFAAVPQLKSRVKDMETTYQKFLLYKFSVPTCGAVLLNPAMDKCLMVRGWGKNANLGFPKGKMDAGETEAECAAREVEEEIGVNIRDFIVEEDKVHFYRKIGSDVNKNEVKWTQKNTLYIIQGISEETKFLTHTRKEISDIVWNPLWIFDLPEEQLNKYKNKYSSCFPGLRAIAQWVKQNKKKQPKPQTNHVIAPQSPAAGRGKTVTLEDLEQEIMASYDGAADNNEDDDDGEAYEPFSALSSFSFDKSAIMQAFIR